MTELYDIMPFEYQITESASGRLRVEGVFQRSDVPNANKRIYPRSLWEKELKESRVADMLASKAMFGELDHPADGKTMLKRVSHIVTGLELQEDGTVTGAAEILETPNGQILKTLFESGAQVGISSRGSGSVQNGVVQEDFKLGTFDFVARPSTPGALPRVAGAPERSARMEADETVHVMSVIDDEPDMDADLFDDFMKELNNLDSPLYETADGDLNAVAQDVIEMYNYIMENEVTPELISKASGDVIQLTAMLHEMAANNPVNADVIADLLDKIELSRGALISKGPMTKIIKEEPMNNLEFIKNRLDTNRVDEEAMFEAEVEDLRQKLHGLSDEELIEVALETGALSPDDLEENDDDTEEIDVQALYDYAVELESNLAEATQLVEQLAGALEEAEDVDSITLKYEASLGIIQETVAQYQLLQEAVGGEEAAEKLMESHLNQLEGRKPVQESKDDGSTIVEELLNEDGDNSGENMSEHMRLFEGARTRLNLN